MSNDVINRVYRKNWIKRYLEFVIGLIVLAVAYNIFAIRCNLVYGAGGIGILVNKLTGLDPSLIILICNVILLGCSLVFLGVDSTKKTVTGSLLYPLFVKLTEPLTTLNVNGLETFMVVLCAAILSGFGLGLIFKSGYTSGGTDILNQIVSKYGKMSMGKSMYFTDFIIIIFSIFVFDLPTFVYSVLNLYIVSIITDKVVLGISSSKAFYIITEHETEIKKYITQNLSHGVTVLEARGGYTGNVEKVIMCIIPTKEYYVFKEGIKMIDENAFFVVTDAYEVSGGA